MKVVHITPHVGGGVGSVLRAFFDRSHIHNLENHLYCLDFCSSNFHDISTVSVKADGVFYSKEPKKFLERLDACDVLLIHYWNHPLMAKFLVSANIPSNKTVLWVHNSGLFEPHIIPSYLFNRSRKILFTSACSYEAPNLQSLIAKAPHKFGCVHSTRDLTEFLNIGKARKPRSVRKSLLYVGTVSGAKMHPHSAEIFARLSKRGFHIKVVGGPDQELLRTRVESFGGCVEVFGEVREVVPFFATADIFIYPLKSEHYGTGEQVILEAMAANLPVVAFDNPAERVILEKGCGLLVDSVEGFVNQVCNLSDSVEVYSVFSNGGASRVKSVFDFDAMVRKLTSELKLLNEFSTQDEYCSSPKKFDITRPLGLYALHSFFNGEALVERIANEPDNDVEIVFKKIESDLADPESAMRWVGRTKATPSHYRDVFNQSSSLLKLDELIVRISKDWG